MKKQYGSGEPIIKNDKTFMALTTRDLLGCLLVGYAPYSHKVLKAIFMIITNFVFSFWQLYMIFAVLSMVAFVIEKYYRNLIDKSHSKIVSNKFALVQQKFGSKSMQF